MVLLVHSATITVVITKKDQKRYWMRATLAAGSLAPTRCSTGTSPIAAAVDGWTSGEPRYSSIDRAVAPAVRKHTSWDSQ